MGGRISRKNQEIGLAISAVLQRVAQPLHPSHNDAQTNARNLVERKGDGSDKREIRPEAIAGAATGVTPVRENEIVLAQTIR